MSSNSEEPGGSSPNNNATTPASAYRKTLEAELERLTKELATVRVQKAQQRAKIESLTKEQSHLTSQLNNNGSSSSSSSNQNSNNKEKMQQQLRVLHSTLQTKKLQHSKTQQEWQAAQMQYQRLQSEMEDEEDDIDVRQQQQQDADDDDDIPPNASAASREFLHGMWDRLQEQEQEPSKEQQQKEPLFDSPNVFHGVSEKQAKNAVQPQQGRTAIDKHGFPMPVNVNGKKSSSKKSSSSSQQCGYNTATTSEEDDDDDDDEQQPIVNVSHHDYDYEDQDTVSLYTDGGTVITTGTEHTKDSLHLYQNKHGLAHHGGAGNNASTTTRQSRTSAAAAAAVAARELGQFLDHSQPDGGGGTQKTTTTKSKEYKTGLKGGTKSAKSRKATPLAEYAAE